MSLGIAPGGFDESPRGCRIALEPPVLVMNVLMLESVEPDHPEQVPPADSREEAGDPGRLPPGLVANGRPRNQGRLPGDPSDYPKRGTENVAEIVNGQGEKANQAGPGGVSLSGPVGTH